MALDPQVRRVIDRLLADGLTAVPGTAAPDPDDVVAAFLELQGEPAPVDDVWRLAVPGPDGELPAMAYRPLTDGGAAPDRRVDGAGPLPVLVYLHAGEPMLRGGFEDGDFDLAAGGLDLVDRPCRALATATGAVVASVRCRAGVGAPFPTGLRDGEAAVAWFAEHAAELGGDPARIGVAGHGIGATVAAALTQLARRRGPVLALQLLLCPVLDLAGRWPSRGEFAAGYPLTASDLAWFARHHLAGVADAADPLVSPLRARDLAGLPPTAVVTAGFDPLRDEGRAYAAILDGAGVPVLDCPNETMAHGFFLMAGAVAHAGAVLDLVGAHAREVFAAAC